MCDWRGGGCGVSVIGRTFLCGVPVELQVSVHVCLAGASQGECANQGSSETQHTVLLDISCQRLAEAFKQHSVCSFRGTLIANPGGHPVKTGRQRSGAAGSAWVTSCDCCACSEVPIYRLRTPCDCHALQSGGSFTGI